MLLERLALKGTPAMGLLSRQIKAASRKAAAPRGHGSPGRSSLSSHEEAPDKPALGESRILSEGASGLSL